MSNKVNYNVMSLCWPLFRCKLLNGLQKKKSVENAMVIAVIFLPSSSRKNERQAKNNNTIFADKPAGGWSQVAVVTLCALPQKEIGNLFMNSNTKY